MARPSSWFSTRSLRQKWKELPSLRCSATRTFSRTERCGKTAEIWNERTRPMRAIAAGELPVMSRPLKWIRPAVGVRKCVSRLKNVVLPAPFGPIRAWMVWRRTLQIDVLDRDEALELLRQPFRLENYFFFGHPASPAAVAN